MRSYPAITGKIISSIPNNATVMVNGQTGNWYVVTYNGISGYASADYIIV